MDRLLEILRPSEHSAAKKPEPNGEAHTSTNAKPGKRKRATTRNSVK
jgi:hypothetical protein